MPAPKRPRSGRRKGIVRVICASNPRHKQRQG